jgi:hypothetical protein
VLIVLGLRHFRRGIRTRQDPDSPFCTGCGYNLTGLPSPRCPECGRLLTSASITYGQRVFDRRRLLRSIVPSATAVMLVVAGRLPPVRDFSAYRFASDAALVAEVTESRWPHSAATWELRRRINNLGDVHLRALVDTAVDGYLKGERDASFDVLQPFVQVAAMRGLIDTERLERSFDQLATFELQARARVREGDPIPFALRVSGRPGRNFDVHQFDDRHLDCTAVCLGQTRVQHQLYDVNRDGNDAFNWKGTAASCSRGTYQFSARLQIDCRFLIGAPVLFGRTLTTQVQVVPASEDPVRLLGSPGLDEAVRAVVTDVTASTCGDRTCLYLNFVLDGYAPVPAALEVIVQTEEGDVPREPIILAEGETSETLCRCGTFPRRIPERFDVVLRGSDRLVRESLDLYETWCGELLFEDVVVEYKED